MKIQVRQKYEELIPGNQYTLVHEGRDYYQVKVKGQAKFVPKWVFEGKIAREYQKEEVEDEFFLLGE